MGSIVEMLDEFVGVEGDWDVEIGVIRVGMMLLFVILVVVMLVCFGW